MESNLNKAIDFVTRLFALSREEATKQFGEVFTSYHSEFFSGNVSPLVVVYRAQRALKLAGDKDKSVLECGCGDGLDAILMRLLGAKRVVGVDPAESKHPVQQELLRFSGMDNVEFVHLPIGDYKPDEKFDVAVASASLSHVPEVDETLSMLASNLNDKGSLIVFEDNNIMRRGYHEYLEKLWDKAERGELVGEGVQPVQKLREEYITEHIGELSAEQFEKIHAQMRGLYGEKLLTAVRAFIDGKPFENPPPHPARIPATGETLEYPFHLTT